MKAGQTFPRSGGETGEMEEKQWAVISFRCVEATGLTYAAATDLISELEQKRVPGLCIITAKAADRVQTGQHQPDQNSRTTLPKDAFDAK